jgi:hypothetical protein
MGKEVPAPTLTIGSVVWRFDPNRLVYDYANGHRVGGPLRQSQWVAWEIRGETSRSWIAVRPDYPNRPDDLENLGVKLPKRVTPEQARQVGFLLTAQAVEDDVWAHDHRHRVVQAVQSIDLATLRKVAELIRYDDKAGR